MVRPIFLTFASLTMIGSVAWGQAKPGDPKDETAETSDGVKLHCRFYQAAKESNGSCVILLHDFNADPNKGDWDGLARFLAVDVGMNVFRFDFRGHGKSTEVEADKFWKDTWNQRHVTGYRAGAKMQKSTIDVKDFKSDYYPMLVNDIAAVRNLIDLKNDDRRVNARSVYIVASGSSAPLVFLFLASEWSRAQTKPIGGATFAVPDVVNFGSRRPVGTDVAGKDYAGVVLLSPTRNYTYDRGSQKVNDNIAASKIQDWVRRYSKDAQGGGDIRSNSSLLVMYGDKDDAATKMATWFYGNDLLAAAGKSSPRLDPMKNSMLFPIKNAKEQGVDLLGKMNVFNTEGMIKGFIEKIETDRKRLNPIDRKYDKPFRINLSSFGVN